jgi:hypothetical protein
MGGFFFVPQFMNIMYVESLLFLRGVDREYRVNVYLAGSSSPCGSCTTRTHTSQILYAPRRSVRCARWNDEVPHHMVHGPCMGIYLYRRLLPYHIFISQWNIIVMLPSFWSWYTVSMNAPENNRKRHTRGAIEPHVCM